MDKFDLYSALFLFCVRYHSGQWSRGYRLLGKLHNAGYRPGLTIREGHSFESGEQRQTYKHLVKVYRHKV